MSGLGGLRLADLSLPLREPLGTAKGEITSRDGWLVGVERDGQRGVGEATPLPGWTESHGTCGETLRDLADSWPGVPDRETPAARHGVTLALHDAEARSEGVPLGRHLAGPDAPVADSVAVNATVGDAPVAETVERAESAVAAGYGTIKLKVGVRDPEEDVARVRAVRDAVGSGVTLRADANGAWDYTTARDVLVELAEIGVEYVEQPVPGTELGSLSSLRGRGVGVAADESLAEYTVREVVEADAADTLILKPMALGGPESTLRAAGKARTAGVTSVVTTTIDGAVARAGAVHVAACLPGDRAHGVATGDLLAEDVGPDPVPVVDGRISVPDGPGVVGESFDSLVWDE
jgi:o-succinylbenzoate synthase